MSRLSYEEILSIQRKTDIVNIISDYVPLKQKGRNYFGVCPFHDDHNPSMSVSTDKQIYKCFVCGASGNVFNFVMDYEKVSYPEAIKIIADKVGISVDISNIKKETVSSPLYDIYDISFKYYQNYLNTTSGKLAKNYLEKRNISLDLIKHFGIGLSPSDDSLVKLLTSKNFNTDDLVSSGISIINDNKLSDIYKNRIMFPLWDLNGRVVGFSGRVYEGESTSKYVNTKETKIFKKGNLLYNYHNAKEEARKKKSIIIVEGFMDVIRLYSIGVYNVVATMGTAITKEQANLIRKLSMNVILMFDGDSAGEKATLACIEELKNTDANISVIRLEDNLDPDEYILKDKDKMLYHLSHPTSLFDYKSEYYKKELDLTNSRDISKYINLMKDELSKIDDDIVLDIEMKKISSLTGVSIDTIKSKLDINNNNDKIISRFEEKKKMNLSRYDKVSKYILFYIIKNNELINYYFENLSYLPNDLDRKLANEIVLFYKKYDSFNPNDFITYLEDKKDLINRFLEIDEIDYSIKYDKKLIDDYFDVVKGYLKETRIKELEEKMKKTSNVVEKRELAKEIASLRIKENM